MHARRRWARLSDVLLHPLSWLFAILVLVAPVGDFPLNDDWQYARAVKRLVETHQLVIDTPVAPSLVGQVYVGALLCALFGFSHTLLRLSTLLLGVLLWWSVDRLLRVVGTPERPRHLVGIVLVTNPIFVPLALSFMNELWGWAPCLLAAAVWFEARARADAKRDPAALPAWTAPLVGLAIGLSFWTRQLCAVTFPALLLGSGAALLAAREGRRLARAWPSLLVGVGIFCGLIGLHFLDGVNARPAYRGPLSAMTQLAPELWTVNLGTWSAYLIWFVLPLCFLGPPPRSHRWLQIPIALLVMKLLLHTSDTLRGRNLAPASAAAFLHGDFPYLSNLVHAGGIGPNTLFDVFFRYMPRPLLAERWWLWVEWLLLPGAWFVVGALVRRAPRVRHPRSDSSAPHPSLRGELIGFAATLAITSFLLAQQAFRDHLFDRYQLPSYLGLLLILGGSIGEAGITGSRLGQALRRIALAATLGGLALYTVAGLHDYFGWNTARWRLVDELRGRGLSTRSLQGGYEVNGWLLFDAHRALETSPDCIGVCRCAIDWPEWPCIDDSYVITMNRLRGYEVMAERRVRWWLPPGRQTLFLLRRAR